MGDFTLVNSIWMDRLIHHPPKKIGGILYFLILVQRSWAYSPTCLGFMLEESQLLFNDTVS